MFLWRVFLVKPMAALAVVICLVTIYACFKLERRRPQEKSDRFLIGFLGLLAIYQGFRILESLGLLTVSINSSLDDAIELLITLFYLIAAMLLRFSSINRLNVESAFRLARAAPPRSSDTVTRELAMPKSAHVFEALALALPHLSDGAFRLYAYLCLVAGPASKGLVQDREVMLRMRRTPGEVDGYWGELERSGWVTLQRHGPSIEFEIGHGAKPVRNAAQMLAEPRVGV